MAKSKITWAPYTINFIAGCTKVSPACTNCYAESQSARLAAQSFAPKRYKTDVVDARGRWAY